MNFFNSDIYYLIFLVILCITYLPFKKPVEIFTFLLHPREIL